MSRSSGKIRDHGENERLSVGEASTPVARVASVHRNRAGQSPQLLPLAKRAPNERGRPDPVEPGASAPEKESAVKPGSVLDSHSSGMRVAAQL